MTLSPTLVRERLQDARLYFLLSRSLCRLDPLVVLDEALAAGVDLVQVREKDMSDRELLAWIHDVRERCAAYRVPVLVNDRPDLAILAGAEGVHLGQDDLPPRAVRELVGPGLLVGLSTHNIPEIIESQQLPLDYVGVGPVFTTKTKNLPPQGTDWLEEMWRHRAHPAFPIGGVDGETALDLAAAQAGRAAVSGAICSAEEPGRVVHQILEALRQVPIS